MSETYFQKALSDMATETAYKSAIRHLYNLGKSVEEIEKELLYPVKKEIIEQVIILYKKEKESPALANHYIEEVDSFGRRSFRKI